jgi:hypothetical protein
MLQAAAAAVAVATAVAATSYITTIRIVLFAACVEWNLTTLRLSCSMTATGTIRACCSVEGLKLCFLVMATKFSTTKVIRAKGDSDASMACPSSGSNCWHAQW